MRTPPVEPLRRVLAALDSAGLPAVVGGSALLVSLGLADEARDWDVVTDADPDAVAAALTDAGVAAERSGPSGRYVSEALFSVDGEGAEIDVISRFAILADDGEVVGVPARPGGTWNGLPMARAADWALAYTAMGRPERARLLRPLPGVRPRVQLTTAEVTPPPATPRVDPSCAADS